MSNFSRDNMRRELYALAIEYRTNTSKLDQLVEDFLDNWTPKADAPKGKCGSCRHVSKLPLISGGINFVCKKKNCSFTGMNIMPTDGCIFWDKSYWS